MVQVTKWSEVPGLAADTSTGDTYYYDEQAQRVDSILKPHLDQAKHLTRLYAVKLLADAFDRPSSNGSGQAIPDTLRITAVLSPLLNAPAMKEFDAITLPDHLALIPKGSAVRFRSFIVARMDPQKESN